MTYIQNSDNFQNTLLNTPMIKTPCIVQTDLQVVLFFFFKSDILEVKLDKS